MCSESQYIELDVKRIALVHIRYREKERCVAIQTDVLLITSVAVEQFA